MSTTPWLTIPQAAMHLSMKPGALRRALERRARVVEDGGTEAEFDRVRGRKLGRLWRVQLGDCWMADGEERL